jgi:hypothetical protein
LSRGIWVLGVVFLPFLQVPGKTAVLGLDLGPHKQMQGLVPAGASAGRHASFSVPQSELQISSLLVVLGSFFLV